MATSSERNIVKNSLQNKYNTEGFGRNQAAAMKAAADQTSQVQQGENLKVHPKGGYYAGPDGSRNRREITTHSERAIYGVNGVEAGADINVSSISDRPGSGARSAAGNTVGQSLQAKWDAQKNKERVDLDAITAGKERDTTIRKDINDFLDVGYDYKRYGAAHDNTYQGSGAMAGALERDDSALAKLTEYSASGMGDPAWINEATTNLKIKQNDSILYQFTNFGEEK